MLDKCANPGCTAVLYRLRDGRLFAFDPRALRPHVPGPGPASRGHQYHWLCKECSKTLTLSFRDGGAVRVVRKEPVAAPSLRPLVGRTA